MSKRLWLLLVILIAVGLGVAFALPRTHFAMLGWLRGEAYYAGQPTSYWAAAIQKDPFVGSSGDVGRSLREGGSAAIPVLGQLLQSDDDNVRTQALLALSLFDGDCRELRPLLLNCLKTEDSLGRFQLAAIPMARLPHPEAEAMWMEVIRDNPNDEIRARAVNSLGSVGSKDTLQVLRKLLDDSSSQVQVAAASAIWQLDRQEGMTLPVVMRLSGERYGSRGQTIASAMSFRAKRAMMLGLVAVLKEKDPIARQRAARTIGWLGADAAAIEALLSLEHDTREVWKTALEALRQTHTSIPDSAVPVLVEALQDKDANVRNSAATALRSAREHARTAVPALVAMLQHDSDQWCREQAAISLGEIRVQSAEAVDALADALQHDTDLSVRELAARAIIKLGTSARRAAGSLIAVLKETEAPRSRPAQVTVTGRDVASLRPSVAEALGAIGAADEAVSILTAALKSDPSSAVRRGAAQSLGSIQSKPPAVISALNAALDDKEVYVRIAAAESLRKIDPQNGKSIPVLTSLLRNQESGWPAAAAIERLGAGAKEAVPALIAAAKENSSVRHAMFQALGSIGPDAKDAVPVLVSEIKKTPSTERRVMPNGTESPGVYRASATRALWQITHDSGLTLPVFIELSKDPNQPVRKSVAEGLGQMGPVARSALPVVRELLDDNDGDVREAAAAALRQIDPNAPTPPK